MTTIFEITDGIDTVKLAGSSFDLGQSRQAISQTKGGGIWNDDPLVEGKNLIFTALQNADESLQVGLGAESEDLLYQRINEMVKLLNKARRFGTDANAQYETNAVVYLKVKGIDETNTTYAIVHDYIIRELPTIVDPQVLSDNNSSNYKTFGLTLSRGQWLALEPGQNTQIETSSPQPFVINETKFAASGETISADTRTVALTGSPEIGRYTSTDNPLRTAILFENVFIESGSTVLRSFLKVIPNEAGSSKDIYTKVFFEDTDSSASFSTAANLVGRSTTPSFYDWNITSVPSVAPFLLETAVVTKPLQDVIDRTGWVPLNSLAALIDDQLSPTGESVIVSSFPGTHVLEVIHHDNSTIYGQPATSTDRVHIANKFNVAQLTHVIPFDGVAFGANILGSTFPQSLPLDGASKEIYFGVSNVDNGTVGPFTSLVFDLNKMLVNGNVSFKFQFYNGASFEDIPLSGISVDHTGGIESGTEKLIKDGINAANFNIPSTFSSTSIDGKQGYWIKLVVITENITTNAEQIVQDIYTVTQPLFETSAINGTVNNLYKLLIRNESAERQSPTLYSDRIVVGVKKKSNSETFTSYINCTDHQNGAGISVTMGADTAEVIDNSAPNGFKARFTTDALKVKDTRVQITIPDTVSADYYGRYRVYARVKANVADAMAINISLSTGNGSAVFEGSAVTVNTTSDYQLIDLSQVSILPPINKSILSGDTIINIDVEPVEVVFTPGRTLDIYDIVLMPSHVWLGDFANPETSTTDGSLKFGRSLNIDSTSVAVDVLTANVVDDSNVSVSDWSRDTTRLELPPNEDYVFHVLSAKAGASDEWIAEPWVLHSAKVFVVGRYLTRRGDS